jgi:hypothetical protein
LRLTAAIVLVLGFLCLGFCQLHEVAKALAGRGLGEVLKRKLIYYFI